MTSIDKRIDSLRAALQENTRNGWSRRERVQIIVDNLGAIGALVGGDVSGADAIIEAALQHEAERGQRL